jgi:hypothetical protein
MKRKIFKTCIVALSSVMALLTLKETVKACAGGWETDSDYFSLYSSELMGPTRLSPFLYTRDAEYYKSPLDSLLPRDTTDQYLSNTAEWGRYMLGKAKAADIDYFIYKTKASDIEMLCSWIADKPQTLSDSLKRNTACMYLKKNADLEAAKYMLFAKHCEPQACVVYEGDWAKLPVRDTVLMKRLIKEGDEAWEKTKSEFIRFRYGYQLVRLAHYSGQYHLALDLYQRTMSGRNEQSIVALWGTALRGGALTRLKRGDEAAYLFAMLFDRHFNFNWELYRRNFEWSQGNGLPYCKNAHEKVVVIALSNFSAENVLDGMKEIYKLEPGSEYLDLLLTRQLRQLEKNVLPAKYRFEAERGFKQQPLPLSLSETRAFVMSALSLGNLKRPYLWEYTAGYLSYLLGDVPGTHLYLGRAALHAAQNRVLTDHVAGILELQKVDQTKQLDRDFETVLMVDMKVLFGSGQKTSCTDLKSFLFRKLADRYLIQGDTTRAMLCEAQSPQPPDLSSDPDGDMLLKLLSFMERKDLSAYDQMLVTGFRVHYSPEALHEIRGTSFLAVYDYKNAIDEFKKAGTTVPVLLADPYLIHVNDCHDCDYEKAKGNIKMTKLDLAEEMLALEEKAGSDDPAQAEACFKLANACYNLTDYGNNWSAARYYWSPHYYVAWVNEIPDTAYSDCFKALGYYNKAMTLTKDRELAAQCCFMASKCEQNMFYTSPEFGTDEAALIRKHAGYRTYFRLMKGKYADTRFYKQAIGECGYFKAFAGN